MRTRDIVAALLFAPFIGLICLCFVLMLGANYYVATDGDSNRTATEAQSQNTPWAHPSAYFAIESLGGNFADGDIVYVKGGPYTEVDSYATVTYWLVSPEIEANLMGKTFSFVGYTSDPNDGGRVSMNTGATFAASSLGGVDPNTHFIIKNFVWDGGTLASKPGTVLNWGDGNDALWFEMVNCGAAYKVNTQKVVASSVAAGDGLKRKLTLTDCNFPFTGGSGSTATQLALNGFETAVIDGCYFGVDPNALGTFIVGNAGLKSLTITDSTFANGARFLVAAAATDPNFRALSLDGVTVSQPYGQTAFVADPNVAQLYLDGWKTISIVDTSITGDANNATNIWLDGALGRVMLSGVTLNGRINVRTGATTLLRMVPMKFECYSSDFTSKFQNLWLRQQFQAADVFDSNFTSTVNDGNAQILVAFGQSPYDPNQFQCVPNVTFSRNRITCTQTVSGTHLMLISTGSDNARVEQCFLVSNTPADPCNGGPGLVTKADNTQVTDTVIYAGTPMIWTGARNGIATDCTFVTNGASTSPYALSWYNATQNSDPNQRLWVPDPNATFLTRSCLTRHSILDGSRGTYTIRDVTGLAPNVDDRAMQFDRNCYVSGATGLAYISTSSLTTLAGLQAYWADPNATQRRYTLNDRSSIVSDPKFRDPNNLDFRLRKSTPCIDTTNKKFPHAIGAFGISPTTGTIDY